MQFYKSVRITRRLLRQRESKRNPQKWVAFSRTMLFYGYDVFLYEPKHTNSKYIRVVDHNDTVFKVRFSDHKPNKYKEESKDCDLFVGVSHLNTVRTEKAIQITLDFFKKVS